MAFLINDLYEIRHQWVFCGDILSFTRLRGKDTFFVLEEWVIYHVGMVIIAECERFLVKSGKLGLRDRCWFRRERIVGV